jgi:hypothetical protein
MSLIQEQSFSVISVEKIEPIAGMVDEGCYRYIIECGRRRIVGTRFGTLQEVSRHAKTCVDELNRRRNNSGYSFWLRRGRK